MDNRDDILDKIRKCFALANSCSEHEAAAALRQARKLMERHQVSQAEMLAACVGEACATSGVILRPSKWEDRLAAYVAHLFGCQLIFRQGLSKSHWVFVGLPPANTVAAYSFEVLYRQARKARQEYIGTTLKRYKKANKIRRADLYSEGWVQTAIGNVAALSPVEGAAEAIAAYMQLKHSDCEALDSIDRNKGRQLSAKDEDSYYAGRSAGRGAQLHQGVGANKPLMLEG